MKTQSTTKGFAVLSAAGMFVKILSLLYIGYLQRIITKGGYGYYSAAYQIYVFIYVLTNAGIPVAISKMISEFIAVKNYKDAVNYITKSESVKNENLLKEFISHFRKSDLLAKTVLYILNRILTILFQ